MATRHTLRDSSLETTSQAWSVRRRARPQGALTADATEPAWNGYLLTVACSCGVVFGR